jgi:hypothetical protein
LTTVNIFSCTASNTPETTTSSSKHKISSIFPFFRAIGILLDLETDPDFLSQLDPEPQHDNLFSYRAKEKSMDNFVMQTLKKDLYLTSLK